jgi:hypothetical protein
MSTASLKRPLQDLEFSVERRPTIEQHQASTCAFSWPRRGAAAVRGVRGCGLSQVQTIRGGGCRGFSSLHGGLQNRQIPLSDSWQGVVRPVRQGAPAARPAGFEPALPPPEAGRTLIMPVSGVSPFPFTLVSAYDLPWYPVVHCTNPCTTATAVTSSRGIRPRSFTA